MRTHLRYANIVSTLALIFAMSGTAVAAKHYLLSSTKQISPSVLKKLKGKKGSQGPTGPAGPTGRTGTKGERGLRGEVGPSGSVPAYGVINSNGEVIPSKTKYLTASRIGTGSYCVIPAVASGVDGDDLEPLVVADQDDGPPGAHIAETRQADTNDFAQCSGGWVFNTYSFEGGEWRPANVAITVVIP
jgi:Collagen triple helix repeat (20 copies)